MTVHSIVVDTNVIIAALWSSRGAAYRLLTLLSRNAFEVCISVPLVLEYKAVINRSSGEISLAEQDIGDILDYICAVCKHQVLFYLWRPHLRDPKDDMVLEVAVAANCDFIITYNKRDFENLEQFGIEALTPREFLQTMGEL
jgi:putative PIN family toxin of toxin-antitoxin system